MNFTRMASRQVVMEALDDLLSDPDCEGVVGLGIGLTESYQS